MALATTSKPYSVRNRSPGSTRTNALTTPLIAIATKHHSASAENRRAARSACPPRRIACTSRASSPPAHNAPAPRWSSRLLVARSWAPPVDEWPVRPSGTSVASAPASRIGVHDQRSTGMLATVTTAATNAVHRHALAVSTRPATDQTAAGSRFRLNGWPETSDTVSGTISAAHTVHIADAPVPRRNAR